MSATSPAKRELRAEMRRIRRSIDDPAGRSSRIWEIVQQMDAVAVARTVMVFSSVHGEPATAPFVEWCERHGKRVAHPDDGTDPAEIDVVIVPGLAFTRDGHRLGQGGGWYDRFLPTLSPRCTTIGVGFAPQVLDVVPIEAHDVHLDHVVTDGGLIR